MSANLPNETDKLTAWRDKPLGRHHVEAKRENESHRLFSRNSHAHVCIKLTSKNGWFSFWFPFKSTQRGPQTKTFDRPSSETPAVCMAVKCTTWQNLGRVAVEAHHGSPKRAGCPKNRASSNGVLGNDVWFLLRMMSCFRDSSFEFHVHLRKDKDRTPEDRASFVARSLPCIRYLLKHVSAELVSMYVPPHPASGKDPCTQDLKMPSRQSPQLAEPDNSLLRQANCAGQQCCIQ